MEKISNREQALHELENLVNDISTQLRNTQNYKMNKSKYMRIYDWQSNLDYQNKNMIVIKEIFIEWIQKYLEQVVAQNLKQSNDFAETLIFEISLLKSLLKFVTVLFHLYQKKLGSQEIYIVELGLVMFDKLIMRNYIIKQKFIQSFLDLLNEYRTRQNNNTRQILQNLLQIFDIFQDAQALRLEIVSNTEKQLVIQTLSDKLRLPKIEAPESTFLNYLYDSSIESLRKFYNELSKNWLKSGSCAEYINKATNQVSIEKDIQQFFYSKFINANENKKAEFIKIFFFELLEDRMDQILGNPNDGFQQQLIQRKNSQDLKIIADIYSLYKYTNQKLEKVLEEFQAFVLIQVQLVFTESADTNKQNPQGQRLAPNQMQAIHIAQIDNLQLIFEYCQNLVTKCFEQSHKFRNNMELSFKEKLNQQEKFIDKLAMYIHVSLREKLKETTNNEDRQKFDRFLKNIMSFIQLINNKGRLFQKITENLKERIFKGEIKNLGYEEDFLRCLRKEHPEHLPSDMLIVWKDFKFYRNLDSETQNFLNEKRLLIGTNLQFTVFTRTNSLKEFNNQNRIDQYKVPQTLNQSIQSLEKYYQQKQQTERKLLVWNYKIGQARINYKFGPTMQQQGSFIVSNLQLFILLTLKQNGNRTMDQLLEDVGIGYEEELNYQLDPLLEKKVIILQGDQYSLQKDQTKLTQQLLPNRPISFLPKKQVENQEDLQQLKKEKDLKIQSCIVRLMKTNKEMIYPQIQQGVIKNLSGYYDVYSQDILAQIDELINGSYIRRDERINNKFIYTPQ